MNVGIAEYNALHLAAAIHSPAVVESDKGFVFFRPVADISLRYAAAENTDLTDFAAGRFFTVIVQYFNGGILHCFADRVCTVLKSMTV